MSSPHQHTENKKRPPLPFRPFFLCAATAEYGEVGGGRGEAGACGAGCGDGGIHVTGKSTDISLTLFE